MTMHIQPQTQGQAPWNLPFSGPTVEPPQPIVRPDIAMPVVPRESLSNEQLMKMLLDPYDPGCRYLRSIETDLPVAKGTFRADYCYTAREKVDIGHFGAFENIVCFNQLGFVMFARGFVDGYFKGVPPFNFTEYKQFQTIGMYILEINNVKYHKAFPANEEFSGILTIIDYKYKPEKRLFITKVKADFAEGKAVGEFTLALKRWDLCFADFDRSMKTDEGSA